MQNSLLVMMLVVAVAILVVLVLRQSSYRSGYASGLAAAQIDAATRLVPATVAQQILAMEFAAAERGRELTVVLFSIDNFRRIAPLQGGSVGAKLLLNIGAILRRRTRGMNVSARFDDAGVFKSVLGGVSARGAMTFAQRVCKDLSTIDTGYQQLAISTSVCEYSIEMHSVGDLMERAFANLTSSSGHGVRSDALQVAG